MYSYSIDISSNNHNILVKIMYNQDIANKEDYFMVN